MSNLSMFLPVDEIIIQYTCGVCYVLTQGECIPYI